MNEYKVISCITPHEHQLIISEGLIQSEWKNIIMEDYPSIFQSSVPPANFSSFWKKYINKEKDESKIRETTLKHYETNHPEEFNRKKDIVDKLLLGDDAIEYLTKAFLEDRKTLRDNNNRIEEEVWGGYLIDIWKESNSDSQIKEAINKIINKKKFAYCNSLDRMTYDEIERILNYYGKNDWRYRSLQYITMNNSRILDAIILDKINV